ncbi:hypothetical protein [Micromonospora sp. B006]|uniref:hypothetical protein n=1 Tax=Micromonospora sp. B006 TaxID=2201999 RepID=UPI000E305522|nr:hypothetical protein [Micromonospora sp. B006]
MSDRRVTVDDLGAWPIKGNADAVDLAARFAADPRVTGWCVRPGYRVRPMRPGQTVVFWASGSRGRAPYGVWGVGRIAAAPQPPAPGEAWTAPLDLTILDEPLWVRREVLRADPLLAGAEVLRQPQAANPSYLTVAQFEALRGYLPARLSR